MIIKKPGRQQQNKINTERQNKLSGNAVFCADQHNIASLQSVIRHDHAILLAQPTTKTDI